MIISQSGLLLLCNPSNVMWTSEMMDWAYPHLRYHFIWATTIHFEDLVPMNEINLQKPPEFNLSAVESWYFYKTSSIPCSMIFAIFRQIMSSYRIDYIHVRAIKWLCSTKNDCNHFFFFSPQNKSASNTLRMLKPGLKRMFIQSFVCQKDKATATPSAFARKTEENRRWDEFYYQVICALLCFVVLFVQLEVMRWKSRLFINWLQRKTERTGLRAIIHRRIIFTNVHKKLCQYLFLWQTVVQHTQYLNTSQRSANQRKHALCRK